MKFKVTIPEPCHEDWNTMTPTQKGRFCELCSKEVQDFTFKSNTQIAAILANNDSICGRFRKSQLNHHVSTASSNRLQHLGLAFSFTSLLTLCAPAEAQEQKATIEQVHFLGAPALVQEQPSIIPLNIKGTVLDETNVPLPGANIVLKGTTYATVTDFDGNFELEIPEELKNLNSIIEINYIGFITKSVNIETINKNNSVQLVMSEDMLGEVIVVGYAVKKPNIFRRFLNLFKRKDYLKEEEICELPPIEVATDLPNQKVENNFEKSKMAVWPNPVSKQINLEYDLPNAGEYTLSLLPINQPFSTEIMLAKSYKKAGTQSEILEIPNVANGVYVLKLKANGFEEQHKIIVEKN
ncbi:hypothetical protein GCM10011414_24940 [Croceivirga lutea]|uniref:carboxypeptidase-like regulatory domain-containing protein n=1 Tax=Croceivirga lutea TaxID=1775167 RepID=UPI001639BAEF|nr:carboxypeptidase-like regulatory domain-containing protein [Croceivirga lutea]GGG54200.1 hypothetical protein GCM10011414_24940 [Croceivirga lutea]